ncbi:hypothetical protein ACFE04_003297 [Oxalis oulophora]
MKTTRPWPLGIKDTLITLGSRQRSSSSGPKWIIALLILITFFLISTYFFPASNYASCYIFTSKDCPMYQMPLAVPSRELSDEESITQVVFKELLKTPPVQSQNPKIAFMFLTPGNLPFEMLWDKFFHGHEDRLSVYVHSSAEKLQHASPYFVGKDIHNEKEEWGKMSMIDAEKRLLAHALLDPDNQQFVLLSDSCIPLHKFDYVYNYLMFTNVSYIDCFEDPGPHGNGRYSEHMKPEIEKKDFRKASQRQHAIIVMADNLYYKKFKLYCKPNMDGRNCYADEHYLPTLFHVSHPWRIERVKTLRQNGLNQRHKGAWKSLEVYRKSNPVNLQRFPSISKA